MDIFLDILLKPLQPFIGLFFSCNFFKELKGYYKPVEGEFNFLIPSLPMLKNLDIGYPTDVPVGIIQHSLDLAAE